MAFEILPFVFFGGIFLVLISGGIHKISEGYIGLYWRGGALISGYAEAGFQLMIPFITSYTQVQVTVETDLVEEIPVLLILLINYAYYFINSVEQQEV